MGKLFYAEGLDTPFVLTEGEDTGERRYLINFITYDNGILADAKTGDTVKLYHAFPMTIATPTVIAEAGVVLEKSLGEPFNAEEIVFIESKGYKLDSER